MITLEYSVVIEATPDSNFFGFYSPELEGFSGIGRSVDECLERAAAGMEEHVRSTSGYSASRVFPCLGRIRIRES
jgi:predicted RNase H-like HicB family nuclease